jgi:hypothetical protein
VADPTAGAAEPTAGDAEPTWADTAATGAGEAAPIGLDERRDRRSRRSGRPGLAAAAVTLIVAVAGAVAVVRRDDEAGHRVRAGDSPTTTVPAAPAPAAPAEFSATYDGIEGRAGPAGCCRTWRLTVASDGSFRWTSTDGVDDMAYDAAGGAGRHVEIVSGGNGASRAHPHVFVTSGVPAGGPDQRVARPDPLGPIADFVVALARVGDSRITATTVAGRPVWHYDGPTAVDRLGGEGTPDHAVADVDQASGVLLTLTRGAGATVETRFAASDITTADRIDRSRYRLDPPAGAKTQTFPIGFVARTLDEAAAGLPYDLLVPSQVPAGFVLESVAVDRDVPAPTGPEGMNPPTTQVVAMTWRRGASQFAVTLRPKGDQQWDDPFGAEGVAIDAQPVRLELSGRPPLEGQVAVDAPIRPHLWGISGAVVVTVSGDLPRAELEAVAASLRPHRAG